MFNYESSLKFKAAAVQIGPVLLDSPRWFDLNASLVKAVGAIDEAGQNGARLIVLPEGYLPGHPYIVSCMGNYFQKEYQALWVEFLKHSVEVPGPEVEILCKAAKKAGAYVAIGISERDKKYYGAMYNSILFINPLGEVMGTHRKISNTAMERLFQTPGQGGNNLKTIFPTEIGNIGGSICNEHSQYLLQYYWVLQGLEVHCSLWPGMVSNKAPMQARVRGVSSCSGVWSVASCAYIQPENYPPGFKSKDIEVQLCGGSGICSPRGEYTAGPVFDQETIVYGEIDTAEIPKKRSTVCLTGMYNRWDIMSLNVRDAPFEPVYPLEGRELTYGRDHRDQIQMLEQKIEALERRLKPPHNLIEEE